MHRLIVAAVCGVSLVGCSSTSTPTLTPDRIIADHAQLRGQLVFIEGRADTSPVRINPASGIVAYGIEVGGVWCLFRKPPDVQQGDKVLFLGKVDRTQDGRANLIDCH